MRFKLTTLILLAGIFGISIYGAMHWRSGDAGITVSAQDTLRHTQAWNPIPRRLVALMIEKYGPPTAISKDRVAWGARWPWKRIVISNTDNPLSPLEQVAAFTVPKNKVEALKAFGRGLVVVDPAHGEFGARSDRESLNLLALNLGHDIAAGTMSPETAARIYDRTLQETASGKSSTYTARLLFKTESGDGPRGLVPAPKF